jgi:glycosyltransferase involved in cell wall biosynthesis
LFAGLLHLNKGCDVLLRACAILRSQGQVFSLRIIGCGPGAQEIVRAISDLGLTPVVQLQPTCPQADLARWYRRAAVVAVPSRAEGIPNVMLEALACGARVVASAVGGISEWAHVPGLSLVPANDPQALATALSHAVLSPRSIGREKLFRRTHEDAARDLAACLARVAGISAGHRQSGSSRLNPQGASD